MVDRGEENCGDLVDSTATAPKNVFIMSINNDEIENSKKYCLLNENLQSILPKIEQMK